MLLSGPELQQFHYNILDYLTKRSRIMSAYKLSVWNDFAAYYKYKYSDYSREDLRREFLTRILTKVFTYNLTQIQRRKVEIFATHHHFTRSADGFLARDLALHQPVEGEHYVRSETMTQFPNVACIVTEVGSVHETPPDQLISAWASAINSTDAEVASYCFYRGRRLRKRVTQSRQHFHETSEFPENMNPEIGRKIVSFREKAEKLSSILRDNAFGKE